MYMRFSSDFFSFRSDLDLSLFSNRFCCNNGQTHMFDPINRQFRITQRSLFCCCRGLGNGEGKENRGDMNVVCRSDLGQTFVVKYDRKAPVA